MTNALAIKCDPYLKTYHDKAEKNDKDLCRHIYHGSPSRLHFSPYLTKLSYSNSAKFSNMKEAESMVLHLVLKNRSKRYLQTVVGSAHSALGSHSSTGGWSTLGWVHALLSLFHPSTTPSAQCPSTSSSCTLFPDPFPYQCHGPLTRFLDPVLFPNPRQAQPQNKTFWSPSNLSLSTPSLPGFPSQFLCQARVSPPQHPQ